MWVQEGVPVTKSMWYIWKELCVEVGVTEQESGDIGRIEWTKAC